LSVTVTTTTGTEQVGGTNFDIADNNLIVTDDAGVSIAAFAPGVWQSAVVVPS
jgi:hypothetical protein